MAIEDDFDPKRTLDLKIQVQATKAQDRTLEQIATAATKHVEFDRIKQGVQHPSRVRTL